MHCNVFAANGIGQKGGDGSAQRKRSVICDCLVTSATSWQCLSVSLFVWLLAG